MGQMSFLSANNQCKSTDGNVITLLPALLYSISRKRVLVQTRHLNHLSVGLSVRRVYCGKMADWIWKPFGVVNGIDREMGVLDGVGIVEEEGTVLG